MKNYRTRTRAALLKRLATAFLAGVLLTTYAFPVAAIADDSQLSLRCPDVNLSSLEEPGESSQASNTTAGLTAQSNPGTDLITDQKFYTAIVKSISSRNPTEFVGYILGFGFSELFGSLFGGEGDGTSPTIDEIQEKVDKILSNLNSRLPMTWRVARTPAARTRRAA